MPHSRIGCISTCHSSRLHSTTARDSRCGRRADTRRNTRARRRIGTRRRNRRSYRVGSTAGRRRRHRRRRICRVRLFDSRICEAFCEKNTIVARIIGQEQHSPSVLFVARLCGERRTRDVGVVSCRSSLAVLYQHAEARQCRTDVVRIVRSECELKGIDRFRPNDVLMEQLIETLAHQPVRGQQGHFRTLGDERISATRECDCEHVLVAKASLTKSSE